MAQAHKGRPPRLNWRDLIITYTDKGKVITEIAKMDYNAEPICWYFKDREGRQIKITRSGLPMGPDRD